MVQFFRQCDEVMFWIKDKEALVTTEEFGDDLEHVEVLQRKFEEFQKDMASQEYRISEVCDSAEKLINDSHPEIDQINSRKDEVLDAWNNLKAMAVSKQEKLFGAHEIQRFNRDADETIGKEISAKIANIGSSIQYFPLFSAWITEKDTLISTEYGKDLASVQTLQRKHETLERDLAALEDKVRALAQEVIK